MTKLMNKKQEIKNRIDLINKGEVPEGYKCCCGYFYPANWNIIKLKDLFNKVKTKNSNNINLPVLTNSATQGVILQDMYFDREIVNDNNTDGYYIVKDGDFMYNPRISSNAPAGPINRNHLGISGIASPLYTIFRTKKNENIAFIENYFNSSCWHRYMKSVSNQGARHDRLNLTDDDFMGMPIPQPSKQEQEKIAEILSCCDKVIGLKGKLLEEKNKQKEFALYRAISKLKNIKYLKLKNISKCFLDGDWIEKKDQSLDGIRLLQTGNIGIGNFLDKNNHAKYISELKFKELNCTEVFANDILISRLPDPVGRACVIPKLKDRLITAVDCSIVRLDDNYLPEYIILCLNTNNYFKQIKRLTNTSTRDRISRKELENVTIPIASSDEQQKLALNFKHINQEINLLEQELEQYKKLKKSLSQLLLTGIVRVNEV